MLAPEQPSNERARLAALQGLDILDSEPTSEFDRIVDLAIEIFHVPIALVSLVDADRQWFKARRGLEAQQTGRDISFCGHAILEDGILEVTDASSDQRFLDNPLVCGDPNIRFYAGCPIKAPSGHRIGTLCIIDRVPRSLSSAERSVLEKLAELVDRELRLTSEVQREKRFRDKQSILIKSLGHELRTPFNALLLNISLLHEQLQDTDQQALIEQAMATSNHIGRLLIDMSDLSQFEAHIFELDSHPIRFREMLEKLADNTRKLCTKKGLALQWVIDDAVPNVLLGDADRVDQMLANLLSNALNYTLRGDIRCSLTTRIIEHGQVALTFTVVDTGVGIEPSSQKNILDPFVRGTRARELAPHGYGLGLPMSNHLARLMNGDLTVVSDGRSGTTVTLNFTLPTPVVPIAPGISSGWNPEQALSVLLVEDSPANRMVISSMLESAGLDIHAVSDAEEALEIAATHVFDIILMDIGLPGMSGLECARRIREMANGDRAAIVAISAEVLSSDQASLEKAGIDAILPKPFTKSKLLATIASTSPGRDC